MYAYRIIVSTLVLLVMVMMVFSIFKSKEQSGKMTAFVMLILYALCIVGMWG